MALATTPAQFAWYRNPDWQKFTISTTAAGNIAAANLEHRTQWSQPMLPPGRDPTAHHRGPRVKIGITCYPTYGGSGAMATELGIALAERGHEVHFITYQQPFRLPGVDDFVLNVRHAGSERSGRSPPDSSRPSPCFAFSPRSKPCQSQSQPWKRAGLRQRSPMSREARKWRNAMRERPVRS